MDSVILYTSICGNYDELREDIVCFSDSSHDKFSEYVMNAKIYKILPHKYFKSDITIYMDGNIHNIKTKEYFKDSIEDFDIMVYKHNMDIDCIYKAEEVLLKDIRIKQREIIIEQIDNYRNEGMPIEFGYYNCGFIVRRNNLITQEFCEKWWAEICRYSTRDQLSFAYCLWKMKDKIKLKILPGNIYDGNLLYYHPHI